MYFNVFAVFLPILVPVTTVLDSPNPFDVLAFTDISNCVPDDNCYRVCISIYLVYVYLPILVPVTIVLDSPKPFDVLAFTDISNCFHDGNCSGVCISIYLVYVYLHILVPVTIVLDSANLLMYLHSLIFQNLFLMASSQEYMYEYYLPKEAHKIGMLYQNTLICKMCI